MLRSPGIRDSEVRNKAQCCGAGAGRSRYFFGRSRSRWKDVKAKTCFLLLFSQFLYEKELEPVKKKYLELEPEPVKKDRLRNTAQH